MKLCLFYLKTQFAPRRKLKTIHLNLVEQEMTLLCSLYGTVVIATDYGLDGLGSNAGGDEIFRLPRSALGLIQPPVKWVLGLSLGKVRPGRATDHSPPSSAGVIEE